MSEMKLKKDNLRPERVKRVKKELVENNPEEMALIKAASDKLLEIWRQAEEIEIEGIEALKEELRELRKNQ